MQKDFKKVDTLTPKLSDLLREKPEGEGRRGAKGSLGGIKPWAQTQSEDPGDIVGRRDLFL